MATTAAGIRYPISTDAINIPQDFLNLATDVDTYVTAELASQTSDVNDALAAQSATVDAALAQNVQDVEDALGSLNSAIGIDVVVIMGAF